ncbi:MAG: HAMP domain-containing protein [Anaerolineae bacterium]|nr:HAMP domain-containing protein [Anaerolineae bacterium]
MKEHTEPEQIKGTRKLDLRSILALNIRSRIVLPYLILTLLVAIAGTYVVTNLVASSLDERLTNHLLEAGRVVSDDLVRQERAHLEAAGFIAFTQGMNDALLADDPQRVAELAEPAASGFGIETLVIVTADGAEMLHLLRRADGSLQRLEGHFGIADLPIVRPLLDAGDPTGPPRRAIGLHAIDQRYYYLTALPFGLDGTLSGVIIVGTSLDTLLPQFKATSLADVTVYLDGGRAIASTFTFAEYATDGATVRLEDLSIVPELYESCLQATESVKGENVELYGRDYRIARGPLAIGNDRLAVFSVALPSNFIIQAGTTSRNTYALLFVAVAASVVLIGYATAQRITRPLSRLVRTSQAVAEGDLDQRTGIDRADEIGSLAASFDEMTERLTERTRALKTLLDTYQEASGRMRAILLSIGDGVLLEDMDGNFVPLNPAAEMMLEDMAQNFLSSPLHELTSDEDGHESGAATPWMLDHRRFQMGEKVVSVHSAAVRTDTGEQLGTVIVLRDVTTEAETERLKDAFVAHVSHELRTPLTAIKGYCSLMLNADQPVPPHYHGFLEIIDRQTDSLVMMIEELLDFSEMEAKGKLRIHRQPVSLTDLIEDIAAAWRPKMEEKELDFHVDVPPHLPLVHADPRRLRWAIINLVRNAWQYTPSGGQVTLKPSAQNGMVMIDVIDTGVGISLTDQLHIFDRFYRIVQEMDDDVRGLGLGLYVTKAIVEAHGGELRLTSQKGVGSTFSLLIPTFHTAEETD